MTRCILKGKLIASIFTKDRQSLTGKNPGRLGSEKTRLTVSSSSAFLSRLHLLSVTETICCLVAVFFSRDIPSKLSQKLLLPRRLFFRDVPQRCKQCVSRLQVLGSRLSPRTQRHEHVRWQQSSICRAPHLSKGPTLHRFCLLLCLLQDRVVETEGSRLPAAGTRSVQLL